MSMTRTNLSHWHSNTIRYSPTAFRCFSIVLANMYMETHAVLLLTILEMARKMKLQNKVYLLGYLWSHKVTINVDVLLKVNRPLTHNIIRRNYVWDTSKTSDCGQVAKIHLDLTTHEYIWDHSITYYRKEELMSCQHVDQLYRAEASAHDMYKWHRLLCWLPDLGFGHSSICHLLQLHGCYICSEVGWFIYWSLSDACETSQCPWNIQVPCLSLDPCLYLRRWTSPAGN